MGGTPGKPSTPSRGHQNDRRKELAPNSSILQEAKPAHTVLIIEDATELAEVLRITLERMNLRVFHETHGNKALAVHETEHPDLVLLDIALPDTIGWKVLDTIREQRRGTPNPMIIVITAYGDPANRLMGKLQGVYSYLVKPFTPGEIERVVSKALNLPEK
jgi:DNA-binding response OmpR family regulator